MMMFDPNLIILAKVKDLIILAKTKDLATMKDIIIGGQDGMQRTKLGIKIKIDGMERIKLVIKIIIIIIIPTTKIVYPATIPSITIRSQIIETTINPTLKLNRKTSSALLKVTMTIHLTTSTPKLEKRFPRIKKYKSLSTNMLIVIVGRFNYARLY